MATSMGSHAGSGMPGMESTPVQRTTDSSSVGHHYADLGNSTAKWRCEEEEELKQWEAENKRIWALVEAVEDAKRSGDEWSVVMSDEDRFIVHNLIYWEEERRREEGVEEDHQSDDDDDDEDYDCCRNCGANDVSIFGCCSMRCAKDADEYD